MPIFICQGRYTANALKGMTTTLRTGRKRFAGYFERQAENS